MRKKGEETKMKLLIINGVNLDMLGIREPQIYGEETLENIESELIEYGKAKECEIECYSSNIEGEIVNKLHKSYDKVDGIIINAGAYSHYSFAIRDAIAAVDIPTVEVHISNVFSRELFRQGSVIAPVCVGYIAGLGTYGYMAAIDYFCCALSKVM